MFDECWLERWSKERPNGVALIAPNAELTWQEVYARACVVAGYLADQGAAPGVRVALDLPTSVEFFIALHAILLTGAAALPIDSRLSKEERDRQIAGAQLSISTVSSLTSRPFTPTVPNLNDVALVVHTSGTTSDPRPIELTYRNIFASAQGSAAAIGHSASERWLCSLPLSHVGGLMILLRSVIFGSTTVLDPPPFDPINTKAVLEQERVTLISLVPTMLSRLLEAGLSSPQHLRCAIIGGAPADLTLASRAAAASVPIALTYGLTQACSQVAIAPPGSPEGSVGFPLPGVDVKIAHDGEVLVGGPTVSPSALSEDGFLHTGDLGELTEDGLRIVGRKADTIITGGENVAPQEVEAVLLSHPAVQEAVVFGRAHAEWGEAICAKVVLSTKESPQALQRFCSTRLARFKIPKEVEIVASLPKTSSGKILRHKLLNEVRA